MLLLLFWYRRETVKNAREICGNNISGETHGEHIILWF